MDNNKGITNVFLLEGDLEKSKKYLGDLLMEHYNLHLDKESVDINIVNCENLDTKKLKELLTTVIVKPRGSLKIYIFENGEKLSVVMQNAMLKTFEEPPSYGLFAIMCKNAGALLPTLRSRCNYIYTGFLVSEDSSVEIESMAIIRYLYEESYGSLFQNLKNLNKREIALNFIKEYLEYLDKVDETWDNKIFDTKYDIVLVLEKTRVLIEGNTNCSASLEAMVLNITEVLSDYSSRN